MSTAAERLASDIEQAKAHLRALDGVPEKEYDAAALRQLAKCLAKPGAFRYARQLLAYAFRAPGIDNDLRRRIGQEYAKYTYKDTDLPVEARFDRALEILQEADAPSKSIDPETLGLTGAVYKRKWEFDGVVRHLETSLYWYRKGHTTSMSLPLHADSGYPGINAAFVLELLAAQATTNDDSTGVTASPEAVGRRQDADAIRAELLHRLGEHSPAKALENWWYLVTMAEAALGLGKLGEADKWLERARGIEWSEPAEQTWEYETTARQLASLVCLRSASAKVPVQNTAGWAVVARFVGSDEAALRSVFRGKVGLALSGGGFRASFFHIGVLARLAELHLLRHVEVLSCVSGGSILGAHYYLLLRQLLKSPDQTLKQEDYLTVVDTLAKQFLAGVQTNIRTRALAELTTSLKLIFVPHYTRTRRLGELYESKIYASVDDGHGGGPRWLNALFIAPDGDTTFRPRTGNWRRLNKVPELILNATTLNTGHNWQFTASFMGEPPSGIDREVDGNDRFRRLYYRQAPPKYTSMRLGHAVAASSCVPGLFEPLTLPGLYVKDERAGRLRTVRLVDGGVHDNQGVASLLEQDCTVLLVSDASGQMESIAQPRADNLGALFRSFSISQARVRVAEYHEMDARRRAARLRALMFVHLKKDLDVDPVPWIGCTEPIDHDGAGAAPSPGPLTRYIIRKDMQRLLAAIRTDLDSFSETEAYALMFDGYRMAKRELESLPDEMHADEMKHAWSFQALEDVMCTAPEPDTPVQKDVVRLLGVARNIPLKVWRLPTVRLVLTTLVVAAMASLSWMALSIAWKTMIGRSLPADIGRYGGTVAGGFLAVSLLWSFARVSLFREPINQVGTGVALGLLGVVGWPFQRLHLHVFDRVYKWRGSFKRVLGAHAADVESTQGAGDGSDSGGISAPENGYRQTVNRPGRIVG